MLLKLFYGHIRVISLLYAINIPGWRIVTFSNKVTVTLFVIYSITYDSGMRDLMLFCDNSVSDFFSHWYVGLEAYKSLQYILALFSFFYDL